MKYSFMVYGSTHGGGGFPAADNCQDTLAEAVDVLVACWTHGDGWVEVMPVGKRGPICHLVYAAGKLTKVHKFNRRMSC